jgi:citrate lyase subunit beta/citryl-CoA lyase
MARRSVLFSPGDDPAKLRKATDTDADVVVFDLEDGVAPDRKAAARDIVREALAAVVPTDCELCVRVNPVGSGAEDDIEVALDGPAPDSVMLPKPGAAGDVDRLAGLLGDAGLDLPVLALVESAAGVLDARAIAAAEATDALIFGAEDLTADIGATRTDSGAEVGVARQRVVLAARAGGVTPIDTHYPNYTDESGLRADTRRAAQLGYDGKLAVHPAQATVINEVFEPTPEQVRWAKRILDERDRTGEAVFVVDGEMIDAPQIRQAERVLARAGEERA